MENNEDVGNDFAKIIRSKKDVWSSNVESYFITLMEEEVKKGNRRTTTLTKGAWRYIREELKRKFDREYTYDQFKNKFNQLRARWKNFTTLLKMEVGLGYNSSTGQIIATNDQWKKLCEKYKFGKQFKKKGCLHYDKLCVIFDGTILSGTNQYTKSPSISDDNDSDGDKNFDEDEDSHQLKRKANISKDSEKRKARESVQMPCVKALTSFGETRKKKKLEILEKMSASHVTVSTTNATGEGHGENMQDKDLLLTCVAVLQGLQGIDSASFTKALHLLKEDALWRDVFMALSDDRKKDWVLNLV